MHTVNFSRSPLLDPCSWLRADLITQMAIALAHVGVVFQVITHPTTTEFHETI
ncbi:hypothetical protein H6F96_03890 [Microcoleus sp. FACHB-53]|nr:hypothetical protein [Microcoleus sp. FACHB-53]MBD2128604.1 hypothetical protein [Microcoleus sp. FACHB-1]